MKTFIHHEYPKLERKTSADGSRVYATPSGRAYPSVTTVTGLHSKQGILDWRKKVGEEAVEVVIEAKDNNDELFKGEAADLLFHYLILLQSKGYKLADVVNILEKRHKA